MANGDQNQGQDIQPGTIAVWGTGERQQWDGQKWTDLPNIPRQNYHDFQRQFLQQKEGQPVTSDFQKLARTQAPSLPGYWARTGQSAGVGQHPWESIKSTYAGLRDQPGATMKQLGSEAMNTATGYGNAVLDVLNPLRPVYRQLRGQEPTMLDTPLAQDIQYKNWPGVAGDITGTGIQIAAAKYGPKAVETLPYMKPGAAANIADKVFQVGESAQKDLGSVISDEIRTSIKDKETAAKEAEKTPEMPQMAPGVTPRGPLPTPAPAPAPLTPAEIAAQTLENDPTYKSIMNAPTGTKAMEALASDPAATREMFRKVKAVDPNFETDNLNSAMDISTRLKATSGWGGLSPRRNILGHILGLGAGGEIARAAHLPAPWLGALVGGAAGGYGWNYMRWLRAVSDLMAHPYLTGAQEVGGATAIRPRPQPQVKPPQTKTPPPPEVGGAAPETKGVPPKPNPGNPPNLPPTVRKTKPLTIADYTNVVNAVRESKSVAPPMIQSFLHQKKIDLSYEEVQQALRRMQKEGRISPDGEIQFTPEEQDRLMEAMAKKYGNRTAALAAMVPARKNPQRMIDLMREFGIGKL